MPKDPARSMAMLDELFATLKRAGVDLRADRLAAKSGLVTLKGKKLFLLDPDQDPDELAAAIIAALATLDLDDLYLAPDVRAAIEARRTMMEKTF